jgi:glycosyltransferase involved in cell wall biosynthesis
VIIPVFRGAMPRKRSLGSVLKQSHRNLELLVVGHAADRASADAVAA